MYAYTFYMFTQGFLTCSPFSYIPLMLCHLIVGSERLRTEHATTKVLRLSSTPPDYRAVLERDKIDRFEDK